MCYSYYEDFERRTKKDSARKPETHKTEETTVGQSPKTEGTVWTFLARRRREFEVSEPTTERIREKV